MRERDQPNSPVNFDAFQLADLLAQLGETASLEVLLPVLERGDFNENLLVFKQLKDERLIKRVQDQLENGNSERVKASAAVVLAAQGDTMAQQLVADTVGRLAGLPMQTVEPKYTGEENAARDPVAFLILREGMEVVPPEVAVPVLKNIGVMGNYHEYVEEAIKQLARIGNAAARDALLDIAQSLQVNVRGFEESQRVQTGMALLLFNDDESLRVAQELFGADKTGFEGTKFVAEAKGWKGGLRAVQSLLTWAAESLSQRGGGWSQIAHCYTTRNNQLSSLTP
jgi:hypothetical protein